MYHRHNVFSQHGVSTRHWCLTYQTTRCRRRRRFSPLNLAQPLASVPYKLFPYVSFFLKLRTADGSRTTRRAPTTWWTLRTWSPPGSWTEPCGTSPATWPPGDTGTGGCPRWSRTSITCMSVCMGLRSPAHSPHKFHAWLNVVYDRPFDTRNDICLKGFKNMHLCFNDWPFSVHPEDHLGGRFPKDPALGVFPSGRWQSREAIPRAPYTRYSTHASAPVGFPTCNLSLLSPR